ncbi:hypothetical protein [Kitasatospora sp. NBC_01302]|uniref:hypothetical protein n=1 Tax=Kitasatospora sp. NBC_01302 TaxID=2903575 RepID=UPI002E14F348|nr:hypothetical protein OG294_39990 [Kitasatospora sp. NBC_01302]
MFVISPADFDKAAPQLEGRHHPHFQGTAKTEFGNLVFTFKPFTGTEEEPATPAGIWQDASLTREAREVLAAEYADAYAQWSDAKYVAALKRAVTDAGIASRWTAYIQARQEMDALFSQLRATADTHWRASVSKLVDAQELVLAAAESWDRKGLEIARIHHAHRHSDLSYSEAYRRAGIEADSWAVDHIDAYDPYDGGPLTRGAVKAVEAQREHLRMVAALTGDRSV